MLGVGRGDKAKACILALGSVYTDNRITYQLEVRKFGFSFVLSRAYK